MRKCLLLFFVLSALVAPAAAAPADSLGQKIADFELRDYRGKAHTLAEYNDNSAVVVVFLGCECPLAKQYAPRLQKLAEEYGRRGVAFLGVDANSQDTLTELAAYARTTSSFRCSKTPATRWPISLPPNAHPKRSCSIANEWFAIADASTINFLLASNVPNRRAATWRWRSTSCCRTSP
jgi:thiol-disulfide isomerase/thioredoxin